MFSLTHSAIVMIPLALLACWFDITQRRLPNWLVLVTLGIGLALALLEPRNAELTSRLGHAIIALVIGMGLYRIGLVGAGDAKFYAAVAAWFSLGEAPSLMLSVALCGFVLAVGWIVVRRLIARKPGAGKSPDRHKLPFGVAIAGGAVAALLLVG